MMTKYWISAAAQALRRAIAGDRQPLADLMGEEQAKDLCSAYDQVRAWHLERGLRPWTPRQTIERLASQATEKTNSYLERAFAYDRCGDIYNCERMARLAWHAFYDRHKLPADIPRDPDLVYEGWVSWKAWWLGALEASKRPQWLH